MSEGKVVLDGMTRSGWRLLGSGGLVPRARLSGPTLWVIAIMVALTVIAAATGLALRNIANAAAQDVAGGVTVQIIEAQPAVRQAQARAAARALGAVPGVASVRLVPAGEVDDLLTPWLGAGAAEQDVVPVPALIDVRLDGGAGAARVQALRAAVARVAPAARVDAQAGWLAPVFEAIDSLRWLALAMVALLAVALAASVLLSARSALGAHRETIEIVHNLGGTDRQIARIFQRSIGQDAALGSAMGLAVGLAAVLALGSRFAALGAGLIADGALGPVDWLVLALVPLVAVGLAMVTARMAVLSALRRLV